MRTSIHKIIAGFVFYGRAAAALCLVLSSATSLSAEGYIPTMEDWYSIQKAIYHYQWGRENMDNPTMAKGFTEDGTLMLVAGDVELKTVGRDNIAAKGLGIGGAAPQRTNTQAAASAAGFTPPAGGVWHFVSGADYFNFESPMRATHYGYWISVYAGSLEERRSTLGNPGHYEDIFVKRNGEWLFLQRKIVVGVK